jgi:hypothetical protein
MVANSGKPSGNRQPPTAKTWLKCGEVGTYAQLNKKRAFPKFERDHVPSAAAMRNAAKKAKRGMSPAKLKCVNNRLKEKALTIAIPTTTHRRFSRTCGSGRNTSKQINNDGDNLSRAANKDLAQIQKALDGPPKNACADAYRKAAKKVKSQDHNKLIRDVIAGCPG